MTSKILHFFAGLLLCVGTTSIERKVSFKKRFYFPYLARIKRYPASGEIMTAQGAKLFRVKRDRSNSDCPESCSCTIQGNDFKLVRCFGLRKTKIPAKIPGDATALNLAYNRIETVEAEPLSELKHLKSIDLSHNKIYRIEHKAFQDTSRVEWLDLSHNIYTNLTLAELSEASRTLLVLNISNTNLKELPRLHDEKGVYMTRLKTLTAFHNNFTEIPSGHIPSSVTSVQFSCLRMNVLPRSAFQGHYTLKDLTIRGCPPLNTIISLEDGALESLNVLTRLDLSGNSLSVIPRGLPGNLQFLDLSHNQIANIKTGACATQESIINYYTIPLSDDDVQDFDVGSELSRLYELVELRLNDNLIQTLCVDDFIFMQQLQILNLTNCAIKSFHYETFLYPQSLRVLDISRNYIGKFRIAELPDLEELYVDRNLITEVEDLTNSKLPSLKEADFSYNRYTCDCKLKDFVQFLAGTYNQNTRFRYLSATSSRYTCFKPYDLRDKPLMSVDIGGELICEEETTPVSWPAIAAPVSLIGIFLIIMLILCISRLHSGKWNCSCKCCSYCKANSSETKKVTSSNAKYEVDSDIVIKNNPTNDVAILCHETNQKWILSTFVPKLHRRQHSDGNNASISIQQDLSQKPLNVEVFTIGSSIRLETLHRCIDVNRKIALIVTHEFLKEETCRFILKVMQERLVADPKDAVVCVIMDSIPWKDMPGPLQKLIAEKTFLQYPQKDRERQEFYFWDNLSSLINKSEPTRRQWQDSDEEIVTSSRFKRSVYDDQHKSGDNSTIRSSRRARPNEEPRNPNMRETRAARLQRLGINSNGEVAESVLPGVAEAKQLARKRIMPNDEENFNIKTIKPGPTLISQPSTYNVPAFTNFNGAVTPTSQHKPLPSTHQAADVVLRDIDELYSTRKDMFLFGVNRSTNGRVHSLLPPNCDDVDSIYSEDEEDRGDCDVRPPERDRSRIYSSDPSKKSGKGDRRQRDSVLDADNENFEDIENLHGTVVDNEDAEIDEEKEDSEDSEEENKQDIPKSRRNKALTRLKSFF